MSGYLHQEMYPGLDTSTWIEEIEKKSHYPISMFLQYYVKSKDYSNLVQIPITRPVTILAPTRMEKIRIKLVRKIPVRMDEAAELVSLSMKEFKERLKGWLAEKGYRKAEKLANLLIEEAEERAEELVKKYFKTYTREFIEAVARLILAIPMAEEWKERDEVLAIYTK